MTDTEPDPREEALVLTQQVRSGDDATVHRSAADAQAMQNFLDSRRQKKSLGAGWRQTRAYVKDKGL